MRRSIFQTQALISINLVNCEVNIESITNQPFDRKFTLRWSYGINMSEFYWLNYLDQKIFIWLRYRKGGGWHN
ncbi:hypothetical protein KFK09_022767 [Dendrobium nobile]|uniref:Uncharacterized protein n=1 Tax=Dendrobium nobile TaxID=94219 RepID=A0A8T3AK16_DENNO|nr:hypothetical protein KFK09_022767 [Dendrobium nobile]